MRIPPTESPQSPQNLISIVNSMGSFKRMIRRAPYTKEILYTVLDVSVVIYNSIRIVEV